jgi:hypothetical protein
MTEEKKPAEIEAEAAVLPVPFALMQAITNYLTTKPYREVSQFLSQLATIPAKDNRADKKEK